MRVNAGEIGTEEMRPQRADAEMGIVSRSRYWSCPRGRCGSRGQMPLQGKGIRAEAVQVLAAGRRPDSAEKRETEADRGKIDLTRQGSRQRENRPDSAEEQTEGK